MAASFHVCKQKGFDGIEPDNMDVYSSRSGFPLAEKDGIDYANSYRSSTAASVWRLLRRRKMEWVTTSLSWRSRVRQNSRSQ
jgi:hypothetical protein